MTTYNSYEAAKIANPDSEIVTKDGCFATKKSMSTYNLMAASTEDQWVKCNPADYCMTVEKFLADGHRFVEGDWYIENDDSANKIDPDDVEIMNEKSKYDATVYILRAAALEEKKPRTKVEYVEVTDSIFDLRPDFEAGELFSKVNHARDYSTINNTQTLAQALHQSCCYRRIETPMTEREAFIEGMSRYATPSVLGKMFDSGCRFVN